MAAAIRAPGGNDLYISGAPLYKLGTDYFGDSDSKAAYIYTNYCQVPGGKTRSREIHLHAASITVLKDDAVLDTSGTDGIPSISANSKDADATDAYPIYVSTAELHLPNSLELKATGGNGGVGFTSSDPTIPAGVGGRAGNGANITLMVNTEYDLIADQADAIISDPRTSIDKTKDMLAWAQAAQQVTAKNKPDGVSWVYNMRIDEKQPDMDPEGPLPHAINSKTFLGLIAVTALALRDIAQDFLAASDSRPGEPGDGGFQAGSTKKAAGGPDGTAGTRTFGTYSQQQVLAAKELVFHPAQVSLTIRDIENSYFIGTQDSIGEAMSKLKALKAHLGFLQNAKPSDNLYQAYLEHEFDTLAVLPSGSPGVSAAMDSLSTNLRLANQYMVRINQGYDFYQHEGTWVPRGSYAFYQQILDSILVDFDVVEANYNDYQKLLADNASQSAQVSKALSAARSGEDQATRNLTTLGEDLAETAERIASLQEDIPRKHAALDQELAKVESKIKTDAQWPSVKEFLGAAGQMAFCSSPEMAVGMGAIEGGTLLNSSLTAVHDDAGNSVNKDYIIQQIRQLTAGFDGLKEALQASANDPHLNVDDPAASKLIGEETDIMNLIQKYRSALGGEVDEFKKMYDDFLSVVIQRNNQVLHYNNVVAVFLQTRAKLDSFVNDQHSLGTEEAQLGNSQIPSLASTVKSSYLDYTAKVLELLYDTQRALLFWTLNSGTVQLSSLRDQGFPSTGLGARLKTIKGDLIKDFASQVESLGIGREPFGIPAGSSGRPKIIELDDWQLELLRTAPPKADQEYFTTLDVDVATKTTSIGDSVFAGNADIRISTVRVYLEGAKTSDGILNFTLQHLGDEKIVTVKNETRRFTHDRLVFTFEYDSQTKDVTRDGRLDLDASYALPGPFATWRIGLSPLVNDGLDLSGVTKGWVEFSGWSRNFR